jgi:hypothetical protein
MSCIVKGSTRASIPVLHSMRSRRSSLTLRIQPSLTVGVIAKPRWLMTRFPRVVSMERIASIAGSTSCAFMSAMSTGEPMKGTGSWG